MESEHSLLHQFSAGLSNLSPNTNYNKTTTKQINTKSVALTVSKQ